MIFDSIVYELNGKHILSGVSVKVDPGKISGLFGPNGSGKSTLIRIGAGLISQTSGTISIDGQLFRHKRMRQRYKKISYLSENTFLPDDIEASRLINTLPVTGSDLLIKEFPANLINQKVGTLSSGERRYLELLLIISLDRPFILLDDPFTGIEPITTEKMIDLILEQRQKGKGVLLTDHYYRYSVQIADTAYFFKNGECDMIDSSAGLENELQNSGYLRGKN